MSDQYIPQNQTPSSQMTPQAQEPFASTSGPSFSAQGAGSSPRERRVIDDEELKRMMKAAEPSFMEKYGSNLVTYALIAINVIVFVSEMMVSGFRTSISTQVLYEMGAMFAPAVASPFDWYRFVTPMFLHVDLMHLLFNMAALFSVGYLLERILGRWNYLLLYFIAGISGNVLCYAVDMYTGEFVVSAGASTSVFGLFIAVALLGVLSKHNRGFLLQYSKGMLAVIGVNILYTLLSPGVSVFGHLGGALGGFIAMFMVPSKNLRVPTVVRILVSGIWVVLIGLVLAGSLGYGLL